MYKKKLMVGQLQRMTGKNSNASVICKIEAVAR